MSEGEDPARGPLPDHDDEADHTPGDLDVGPQPARPQVGRRSGGDRPRVSRVMERNPGAWRKPPTVDYFDKEGYFRAGQGPIVFTIAEARARKAGDAIQYLPVLGVGGFIVRGWTHLLAGGGVSASPN